MNILEKSTFLPYICNKSTNNYQCAAPNKRVAWENP